MEERVLLAGEKVQGAVLLEVLGDEFPKVEGFVLSLSFKGKEKVQWVSEQVTNSDAREDTLTGKTLIIDVKKELHVFKTRVDHVQYSFPFEVSLPSWLLSSFFHFGVQQSTFQLTYTLIAILEHPSCTPFTAKKRLILRNPH